MLLNVFLDFKQKEDKHRLHVKSIAGVVSLPNSSQELYVNSNKNIPSVVSKQPSIFPVKLEKCVEESISAQSIEEEILPLILQEDSSSDSCLNKVKDDAPTPTLISLLNKTNKSNEQTVKNDMESVPSLPSQNSDSGICISPELLCNLEVKLEENDTDCMFSDENASASLNSDVASDNSNGPKIVNVVSGDAGANEYFKDILPKETITDTLSNKLFENKSQSAKDLESSSDTNVIYSSISSSSMRKTVFSMLPEFSIFDMQKTVTVIPSGIVDANIHNLLGVRHLIPPITERHFSTRLNSQLQEEKFMTLSPWWMIKKQILPLNPPCTACGKKIFRLNSCFEFPDGLCWTCDNSACRKIYHVKRPKFFERFPSFSLEELLLLTYHWACKSSISVIVKDVPVPEERIWGYFTALQEICGNYVDKNCLIGKDSKFSCKTTVEASAVQLGNFFILCAYDRKFNVSRLRALTRKEACDSKKHIRVLQQWLSSYCILITSRKIRDHLPGVVNVGAEPNIGHVQSPGRHILNASRYLVQTMVQLFQNLCHEQLTFDTIQGILNEVQWRERIGKTEETAFWGIMNEISRMNDSYLYTTSVGLPGEISEDHFFNKADMSFQLRWGPKTSPTFNVSDKAEELPQVTPKSMIITTKKELNSTVSSLPTTSKVFANEIESSKQLHPMSVVGLVQASNLLKENHSINPQELSSVRVTLPSEVNSIDIKRHGAFNTASPTFNVSDKVEELPQVTPKSVIITTENGLNSTVSSLPTTSNVFANIIESSKQLHPISVVGLVQASNLLKEKHSINQEILSIRVTLPDEVNSIYIKRQEAVKTGLQLRKEGFLRNPIRWLVRNKYIKDEAPCYICQGKAVLVDNPKYPDGVSWLCLKPHCMFDKRYNRPSFFGHFHLRFDVIMATIFHWAVQSDYNTTVKSIPLNEFDIISIHRKLQKICAQVSERCDFRIGGKRLVEIAVVRFGDCFILGAMERDTLMTRFRSFSVGTKLHVNEMHKTLISWLHPDSTVVVNSNKYLGYYCMEGRINLVFADKTATDVKSKKYHTLNITNYLESHIKNIFRNLKDKHMSAELLQLYMDELMWRERYRKSHLFVLQCILRDIFAVERGVSSIMTNTMESSVLEKAASFYGFSLPLPEPEIALQRLPEHVINSYTCPVMDTDEVAITDDVDLKNEIEIEVLSDDDVDLKNEIEIEVVSDDDVDLKNEIEIEVVSNDDVDLKKEIKVEVVSDDDVDLKKEIEMEVVSDDDVDLKKEIEMEVVSDDDVDVKKEIKIELVSGANDAEETEVVNLTPNSETCPSTSYICSLTNNTEYYLISIINPVASTSKSEYLVNSEDNRKYSDECYSQKKKEIEEASNWKLQCAECRDFITIDHFAKPYVLNCKYNIYSTYCQKAFARHRANILSGKKIPESCNNSKKFFLPQEWYCLCGYSSLDGNELASHLIQCRKTTCYLNILKPSSIL